MPSNKKITIKHIAERANVSMSTVSRVLRGTAGVRAAKRQAVVEAIDALNYRPNVFAQSLASGQSMTVGVLTQNFGSPFYDGILDGIMREMVGSAYVPMFVDARWQVSEERRAIQLFRDRRVDGLILVGGQIPEDELHAIGSEMPMVVVARRVVSMPKQSLYVDNFAAAYEITQHLISQGHRHIAHITASMPYQKTVTDIGQRLEGYRCALKDAGIASDPQLILEGNLLQQSGVLAVQSLLMRGRPFSAIFAANDQMAFGVRLALFRHGIRVPEDVSLVAFDDEPSAAYMIPPLTTMRQPAVEMGAAAGRMLLVMLGGNKPALPTKFEAKMMARESVRRVGNP